MALDVIINIPPEMIRTREEIVSILDKINDYEKEKHCEAGVVLKQNRQLGGVIGLFVKKRLKEV